MEERLITLVKENTRRGDYEDVMFQIFQISLDYHVTVFHRI